MQKIAEKCGANEKLAKELESNAVGLIVDKHKEVLDKLNHEVEDEDAIRAEFANYGKLKK